MRTRELLERLSASAVRDVVQRMGIPPGKSGKDALIGAVARSLPAQSTSRGPLGWQGAVRVVIDAMIKEDVITVLAGEGWESRDGRTFFARTTELRRLPVDVLRELLGQLCVAQDAIEGVFYSSVCVDRRWGHAFYEDDDAFDEGDDGDDDDAHVPARQSASPRDPLATAAATAPRAPTHVVLPRDYSATLSRDTRPDLPHQTRALEALAGWLRDGRPAGVLCLPTGGGKTRTAARFVTQACLPQRKRTLWLAHRDELVDQAFTTLARNARPTTAQGVSVGRFQRGRQKSPIAVDVMVCSIPTLLARGFANLDALRDLNGSVDLIVVDECHHAMAPGWSAVLERLLAQNPRAQLLGLSATPTRSDPHEDKRFRAMFHPIVHAETLSDLVHQRVLARPELQPLDTKRDFTATAEEERWMRRWHDLPQSLVNTIARDVERNKAIVDALVDPAASWGQTIVFAARLDQAEALSERLCARGMRAAWLSGSSPPEHRAEVIRQFATKAINTLVNVDLFTEGTDLPNVETVVIARPTTSRVLLSQMAGRGLRGPKVGGTERCRILLFQDRVEALGQVLGASFAEEALAFFEIDTPDLAPAEDAATTRVEKLYEEEKTEVPEPGPDDVSPWAEATARRLEQLLTSRGSEGLSAPDPLVGVWQLVDAGRLTQLPVFASEELAIEAFVKRLPVEDVAAHLALRPPLQLAPPLLVQLMVERASAARRSPTWVSLRDLPPESCDALVTAVTDAVAPPSSQAVAEPERELELGAQAATSPPEPDAPADSELEIVDQGRRMGITQRDYDIISGLFSTWQPQLPAGADAATRALFFSMLTRMADLAGVPPHQASMVLSMAVSSGELPRAVPGQSVVRRMIREAAEQIADVPSATRPNFLKKVYGSNFQGVVSDYATFLESVVEQLVVIGDQRAAPTHPPVIDAASPSFHPHEAAAFVALLAWLALRDGLAHPTEDAVIQKCAEGLGMAPAAVAEACAAGARAHSPDAFADVLAARSMLALEVIRRLVPLAFADEVYDARERAGILHLGVRFGLAPREVARIEQEVAEGFERLLRREGILDQGRTAAPEPWSATRRRAVAAAAVAGVVIGAAALAVASPAIAGGIAVKMLGLTGGAASSAGLAMLGGGSLATGGMGMAGGTAVLAGAGGAVTGARVGVGMARRTDISTHVRAERITQRASAHVVIGVSGWLSAEDEPRTQWSALADVWPHAECWGLVWEAETLRAIGKAVGAFAGVSAGALGASFLGGPATAAAGVLMAPVAGVGIASGLVDDPWTLGRNRSAPSGRALAGLLIDRAFGPRPVTLVGFSLGTRVIAEALAALADEGTAGLVSDVVLLGGAVRAGHQGLARASQVAHGRLLNGYARTDQALAYIYRLRELETPIGLGPIDVPGFGNVDLSEVVDGHLNYRKRLGAVLEKATAGVGALPLTANVRASQISRYSTRRCL